MRNKPTLSVIVPVFNARPFLRRALESLLDEQLESMEVIVIDDASTDGSLGEVNDLPVVRVRRERNGGPAGARNSGLAVAQGDLIAFLDASEILVAHGMRWRLEYLSKHPDEMAVMGGIGGLIDGEGKPIKTSPEILEGHRRAPVRLSLEYVKRRGFNFTTPLNCLMVRSRVLAETGGFGKEFEGRRLAPEDIDFMLRLLSLTSIPYVRRPTVLYRIDRSSGSSVESERGLLTPRQLAIERILVEQSYGIPPLPLPRN